MNIYTEMMALLKPNENEEFIKGGAYLNKRRVFNKRDE